jgi:hypothetical protein
MAKQCTTCKEPKPLSEFHRSARNTGGYKKSCKTCRASEAKKRNHPATRAHDTEIHREWKQRTGHGGFGHAKGEKHGRAKLTEAQVLEIRARADEDWKDLAEEFGCHSTNIRLIVNRKIWRHV